MGTQNPRPSSSDFEINRSDEVTRVFAGCFYIRNWSPIYWHRKFAFIFGGHVIVEPFTKILYDSHFVTIPVAEWIQVAESVFGATSCELQPWYHTAVSWAFPLFNRFNPCHPPALWDQTFYIHTFLSLCVTVVNLNLMKPRHPVTIYFSYNSVHLFRHIMASSTSILYCFERTFRLDFQKFEQINYSLKSYNGLRPSYYDIITRTCRFVTLQSCTSKQSLAEVQNFNMFYLRNGPFIRFL